MVRTNPYAPFVNVHKKLSYRRKTAIHAVLVNLCYVLRGMGARKVSLFEGLYKSISNFVGFAS